MYNRIIDGTGSISASGSRSRTVIPCDSDAQQGKPLLISFVKCSSIDYMPQTKPIKFINLFLPLNFFRTLNQTAPHQVSSAHPHTRQPNAKGYSTIPPQMPPIHGPRVAPEVDSIAPHTRLIPQALSGTQVRGFWWRRSVPFVLSERRHTKSLMRPSLLSVSTPFVAASNCAKYRIVLGRLLPQPRGLVRYKYTRRRAGLLCISVVRGNLPSYQTYRLSYRR